MKRTIRLFLFFTIFGKAQVNLNMGLVAYYPFNGNANDASGNNRNGTLVNGATFGLDRFGAPNSSAKFDGVDDYVRIIDNGNAFIVLLYQLYFGFIQNQLINKQL
jgi:hypothetical protein